MCGRFISGWAVFGLFVEDGWEGGSSVVVIIIGRMCEVRYIGHMYYFSEMYVMRMKVGMIDISYTIAKVGYDILDDTIYKCVAILMGYYT